MDEIGEYDDPESVDEIQWEVGENNDHYCTIL